MSVHKGLLVSIDGPSGVGKTTISRALCDRLRSEGHTVTATKTPSASEIGNLARFGTYSFRGAVLTCLVAADRYYHDETVVSPALSRGEIVLCDRYVPSSLVLDVLDGADRNFVWNIYSRLAVPDLAVILTASWEVCLNRSKARGTYSRFHSHSIMDAEREEKEFREAVAYLDAASYPVLLCSLNDLTVDQVASTLADKVRDVSRRHQ